MQPAAGPVPGPCLATSVAVICCFVHAPSMEGRDDAAKPALPAAKAAKRRRPRFPWAFSWSFNRRLSERLGVAEVHGAAVGVVQVAVPRTTVELDQLRIAVADVGGANGDLGVPRGAPHHLDVVGGVATDLQARGAVGAVRILLAIDVVDVPGEVEVTPRPVVGQVHAQLRRTQGADLLARAEDVGDLVGVDPGDGQAVLQAAGGTEVEIGVCTEINTVGLQVTLVRVTSHDLGDTADRVAGDAQAGRDLAVLGRI